MEQFILNVLSGYGLAGVVILSLGWTVLYQLREANKINIARLSERDTLIKALENNTHATEEHAKAIISRNLVTEDLSKSIERQAVVFELFMQKVDIHDEGFKDKLQEFKLVIDSIADAMRQQQATMREIRDRSPSNRR